MLVQARRAGICGLRSSDALILRKKLNKRCNLVVLESESLRAARALRVALGVGLEFREV
jgi:hypothetical protein